MGFLKSMTVLILASTLVACGGKGGGGSIPTISVPVIKPFDTSTSSDISGIVTVKGMAAPNSEITVTFPDSSQKKQAQTQSESIQL